MTPTAADIAARNIRVERVRRRWTQAQLADRIGWSQSKVAAVEQGGRMISLGMAVELCRAFGVPLAKLLEDADPDDLRALGLDG